MTELGKIAQAALTDYQNAQAQIASQQTQITSLQAQLAAVPPTPAVTGDTDDLAAVNALADVVNVARIGGTAAPVQTIT